MAFTVRDYRDLVTLLGQRPEWRSELRQLLLTDEILGLPQALHELTEAQKRAEARLEGIEARLERVEARLEGIESRLERTEKIVHELAVAQQRTEMRVGRLEGWQLEERYRTRAYAIFGRHLRRARVVNLIDLPQIETAHANGQLSDAEWDQLLALDMLMRGTIAQTETYLTVEVSATIDESDVERAQQRAALLRRIGYTAIAGVGGLGITAATEKLASRLGVAIAQDGRIVFWPAGAPKPDAEKTRRVSEPKAQPYRAKRKRHNP